MWFSGRFLVATNPWVTRVINARYTLRRSQPGSTLAGSVGIEPQQLKGVGEFTAMMSHSAVLFPHQCWVGAKAKISHPAGSKEATVLPSRLFPWQDDVRTFLEFSKEKMEIPAYKSPPGGFI